MARAQSGDKTATPYQKWMAEITAAEKNLKKSHERAKNIVRRYLDERDVLTKDNKWFNIFYANTSILESALYSQIPKPIVSRRYKDYQDQVARVAALIVERNITQDLDDPDDTFDSTMRHCVQDRLVPGLAQAWLRLETKTEELETPEPQPDMYPEDSSEETYKRITDQRVCVDYVFWGDFLYSPCRVWEEGRWVARKVYMDRDELVDRWGEDVGNKIPCNYSAALNKRDDTEGSTPKDDEIKKAVIYEIWSRKDKTVIWLSKGMTQIIEVKEDFLKLKGFYPCPKPMLANVSTSNTAFRPDFYMIQDQYNELDSVNNRIAMLIKACKVVGVYDKSAPGVARMLKEGFDNDLIPVDNWAAFAEKGGIKGQIDWLPLEVVVSAINQLNDARERIKAQIYELTGISDIVRGASKASETLGAQEIKAKFASVRIKKLQDEVARFASDIMRIKAEIQIRHFDPQILAIKSNIMQTEMVDGQPDMATIQQALDLLQTEEGFEWRIEVSADTISQTDYELEKKERIEFLTAVSGYLEKAGAIMMQKPEAAPLLVGMLKWAVAGFRNATEIEGMIDKELDALQKSPPPPKPDPEQAKAEAENQKNQAKLQMDQQKQQGDMAIAQQKAQLELMQAKMEFQMEQQRLTMELEAEKQRLALEQQRMQMEMMFDQRMEQMKLQHAQAANEMQLQTDAAQASQQLQLGAAQHSQQLEQSQQQSQQQLDQSAAMSKVAVSNKKAEAAVAPKPAKKAGSK